MSNLNFDQVAANQNQKEVTINDAFDQVDGALTEHLTVDLSAADVALTTDQWTRNWFFEMSGHTVARTVTLPPTKRPVVVKNGGTGAVTLQVSGGGSAVVQPAQTIMVYNDGANLTVSGGGLSDAPADGKIYGRKNSTWAEMTGGDVLLADLTPTGLGTVSMLDIPSTFRSLKLLGVTRTTTTGVGSTIVNLRFNGDGGANYTSQRTFGNKTNVYSDQILNQAGTRIAESPNAGNYSIVPGIFETIIPFYAETKFCKLLLTRWNNQNGSTADSFYNHFSSEYWNSVAAVNRIDLSLASGVWADGTHILLYGTNKIAL